MTHPDILTEDECYAAALGTLLALQHSPDATIAGPAAAALLHHHDHEVQVMLLARQAGFPYRRLYVRRQQQIERARRPK